MKALRTIAALLASSGGAIAQNGARPQFEVASIKPLGPNSFGIFLRIMPGGRVNITNMTLKDLIGHAWNLRPFQISGGPDWVNSTRFDISAKPENQPAPDQLMLMLQSLLEERFRLSMHHETKELSVYVLTLANKDGKLGPKLVKASDADCPAEDPSKPPDLPEPGKLPSSCGSLLTQHRGMSGRKTTLASLIEVLSFRLGRTVIDQTGLTGNFDFTLEWTSDDGQFMTGFSDVLLPAAPADGGLTILGAVREQLGLKLQSQKGPVEVFYIDHAEKPSDN
jgi:uncharacterized protein (TIGR03435 family)